MQIRPAEPRDVPTMMAFIEALAEFEHRAHEVLGSETALGESLFGERPGAEVVIAEDEGRPVGMALFFPIYSTFETALCLHLEDLFVIPDARGKGFGEALLRHVAGIAKARGCPRLDWTVLDWNEHAIRFYQRMGANLLPDWRVCRLEGKALSTLGGTSEG